MEKFRFARVFRSRMILQQNAETEVWGFGARGKVIVELSGKESRRAECESAADGAFRVKLQAVAGGDEPYVLRAVCGGEEIAADEIRFGDCYLLMGQSNMSYALSAVEGREEWAARARGCRISALALSEDVPDTAKIFRPVAPLCDLRKDYEYVTERDEKFSSLSAVGVMTAVRLYEKTRIPVGFVDTSMGGLSVESYLPREDAEGDGELLEFLKRAGRYVSAEAYNRCGERNFTQLGGVYNEKIAPLEGLKFKAIVWYLGESSAYDYEYAQFYARELIKIVSRCRKLFGGIPFAAVQIAPEYYPYGDRYGYLYVNESISLLQEKLENYFAVPIYNAEPRWLVEDGDCYYHPIHPVNKAPVAEALVRVLSENKKFPAIGNVRREGDHFICRVNDAESGICRGPLYGFTVCGENGKYYPAEARAEGKDCIRISSPHVNKPVHMTYAFMQEQRECNARLKTGEAILPYRSERGSVRKGYYFSPPYWGLREKFVRENCFGYNVGTCRLVPCWESGKIYGAPVKIFHAGGGLKIKAKPSNADYFFFGVSPNICLSGIVNHLSDFDYLSVELSCSEEASFYGIAVRDARGEVFRFAPLEGENMADFLPLSKEPRRYCVEFKRAFAGDMSVTDCPPERRDLFVQAEFLFRCKKPCTVFLKWLDLSDEPFYASYEREKQAPARLDAQLPSRQ